MYYQCYLTQHFFQFIILCFLCCTLPQGALELPSSSSSNPANSYLSILSSSIVEFSHLLDCFFCHIKPHRASFRELSWPHFVPIPYQNCPNELWIGCVDICKAITTCGKCLKGTSFFSINSPSPFQHSERSFHGLVWNSNVLFFKQPFFLTFQWRIEPWLH